MNWTKKFVAYLKLKWRISSAGRAPALQAGGRRFDPVILHHTFQMWRGSEVAKRGGL